jgi:hypothetical protein
MGAGGFVPWLLFGRPASPEQSPSHLQEGDITQESPHGASLGCSAGWRANWRRCELVPCRILFDAPACSELPCPRQEDSKKSQKRYFSVQRQECSLVPMATEKAETDRVPVTLARSTISYLEKLVRQGTHGTSVPGVAKTLIEEGIRLAIKDGLLAVRDNSKVSNQER